MTVTTSSLHIRPFAPEEWALFKAIRLKALASDHGVFGRSHEYETAFADEEWRSRLKNPDAAVFGLFEGNAVVGLAGVIIIPETPDAALFVADWLEPAARGKGLSAKMHETRTTWAKARPGIRRLLISFRADNKIAIHAGKKHGFAFTHADDRIWPDGANVPIHHYELRL